MAAARAVLTEILDEAAYEHGERLGQAMLDTSVGLRAAAGVPAHGHVTGLKGSLVFGETPPRNYREFLSIDTALSHCDFLFQNNGGVFLPPWGKSEQWTLSVQHSLADTDRFCDNVARLTGALGGVTEHRSQIFKVSRLRLAAAFALACSGGGRCQVVAPFGSLSVIREVADRAEE